MLVSSEPRVSQNQPNAHGRGRLSVSIRRLGNYLLLEVISPADGAMGVVYRALHDRLKAPRAVKVLKAEVVRSKHGLSRFHREIEIVAKLDHPNIVKAYDAGETNGEYYLVMELLDGVNLARVVGAARCPCHVRRVRTCPAGRAWTAARS